MSRGESSLLRTKEKKELFHWFSDHRIYFLLWCSLYTFAVSHLLENVFLLISESHMFLLK